MENGSRISRTNRGVLRSTCDRFTELAVNGSSTDGGIHPRWSSNGTELLYLAPDGRLLSAAITARGGAIEVGRPVSLFPTMIVGGGTGSPGFRQQYDATADGQIVRA